MSDLKKVGFVLLQKHAGVGGLEKVLEKVVNNLGSNIEPVVYFVEEPTNISFLDKFESVRCYQVPKILRNKHVFRPKILYKYFLNKSADQLFSSLLADDLDVLFVIGLGKQLVTYSSYLNKIKSTKKTKIISWVHVSIHKLKKEQVQLLKIFDCFFAVSNGVADQIRSYGFSNVLVMHNPVDSALPVTRDSNSFLYIGRIDDNKRVSELVEIFSEINAKNYSFDIYGSTGSNRKDLKFKKFIESKGVSKFVNFHGWKEDPWRYINKGGVLLLNSRNEGFGLVLAEAMMRGIACLSADCPTGPADIVIPYVNGWLYGVDDKDSLKKYLEKILSGELSIPSEASIRASVSKFETEVILSKFRKLVLEFC